MKTKEFQMKQANPINYFFTFRILNHNETDPSSQSLTKMRSSLKPPPRMNKNLFKLHPNSTRKQQKMRNRYILSPETKRKIILSCGSNSKIQETKEIKKNSPSSCFFFFCFFYYTKEKPRLLLKEELKSTKPHQAPPFLSLSLSLSLFKSS